MKFGSVPTRKAEGCLLAHSIAIAGRRWAKAHRLTADDLVALLAADVQEVIAARLEEGDVEENEAAARAARALRAPGIALRPPATGRVNLHAERAGVVAINEELVRKLNLLDPAVTLATLAPFSTVAAGQMIATVKIIPFAAPAGALDAWEALATRPALQLLPFAPRNVGLVHTLLPALKDTVIAKTAAVTRDRLARSGGRILKEWQVAHETQALAQALAQAASQTRMVIVFGASALADENDVIPSAIAAAGGHVERVGMPVDPGNLLVLGRIGEVPVIGAPGCARSPKLNGFDWVIDRIMAGMEVDHAAIAAMGVGGLLSEIPSRPQPRERTFGGKPRRKSEPTVGIAILAAGSARRMGGPNKLLALFDGMPLVARLTERALASHAGRTIVVTGHMADEVRAALRERKVGIVHNPSHRTGIGTSIAQALDALDREDGVLVLLADMPGVQTVHLDKMIEAFVETGGGAVVRATNAGVPGNPVILPRALFAVARQLNGDTGARRLIEDSGLPLIDIEIGEAASLDVDTPELLARAGGQLPAAATPTSAHAAPSRVRSSGNQPA